MQEKAKPRGFQKKPVTILYDDDIIYIASSITECAKIFKQGNESIRKLIEYNEQIYGFGLRFAKETDIISSALSVDDINDELRKFKNAVDQYKVDKATIAMTLNHKKRVKTNVNLKKRRNAKNQAHNIYQALLALWKHKYLREPSSDELLVLKGVSTILLPEFHTSQLRDHISAHSSSFLSEVFVDKILSYLNPIVRLRVNKFKHKALTIKSYYILSEDVSIMCHYLRSSRIETFFIPQKEISALINKIKQKYGCNILGVEFNCYFAE